MPSQKKIRSRLQSLIGSGRIADVRRRSRPSYTVDGFVLAVGRAWVLLAQVESGGYPDGYALLRLDDITEVQPDSSFQSAFAATLPSWPRPLPPTNGALDLDSTRGMLDSVLRAGELIGIERDRRFDGLWIGVPHSLTTRWLWLTEVDHRADWHDAPNGYKLATITTVVFGDRYQTALAAMAGEAPTTRGDDGRRSSRAER